MTYFQNIHSLADLKKEYRRLALQHHPDKGGDTAVMQQVNVEFEKLYDVWKDSTNMSADTTGYEYDYSGATAKEYAEYVYITNTGGKVAITRDSTLPRLWNWCGPGSRKPIPDTGSPSDGRITIPFTSS